VLKCDLQCRGRRLPALLARLTTLAVAAYKATSWENCVSRRESLRLIAGQSIPELQDMRLPSYLAVLWWRRFVPIASGLGP